MGSAVSLVGDENFGFCMYFKDLLVHQCQSREGRKDECHNWGNEAAVLC